MTAITPAIVRDAWRYLPEQYGASVHTKDDAVEMQMANAALRALREWVGLPVVSGDGFITRSTTVIGPRIYIPWTPGEGGADALLGQLRTLAHECQHVDDWRLDPLQWPWSYLFDSTARADAEARAYRANLEVHWWATGEMLDIGAIVTRLGEGYALAQPQQEHVHTHLAMAAGILRRGGYGCAPAIRLIQYLQSRGIVGTRPL
jgi:hypothetical protein